MRSSLSAQKTTEIRMRAPLRPTTVARAGRRGNSAGAMRERLEAAKANNSSVDSKLREFSQFAGRQKQRSKLQAHQQLQTAMSYLHELNLRQSVNCCALYHESHRPTEISTKGRGSLPTTINRL